VGTKLQHIKLIFKVLQVMTKVIASLIFSSILLLPLTARAEFSYDIQATIVQSCAQTAALPKCMCYLSNLQKQINEKQLAAVELAIKTGQPADKKLMEKIANAQLRCSK
jgi:uncharacterized membrane protein